MFIKLLTLLFFHQNNILSFKTFYVDGELLLLFLLFCLLTLNNWTGITVGCLIEGGCNSWGWGDLISKSDKRAVFLCWGARFFKIQNKIKLGNLVKITQTKTILLHIKGKLSKCYHSWEQNAGKNAVCIFCKYSSKTDYSKKG